MSATFHLRVVARHLPESFKNFVADLSRPRAIERDRELLDRLEEVLGHLSACIDREVRLVDARLRVLDSQDVRLALGDMRERVDLLEDCFEHEAIGAEGLVRFVSTATELGVGAVRAAQDAEEVADAISSAIDHVQDYMVAHGFVDLETLQRHQLSVAPHDVRKLSGRMTVREAASWQHVVVVHGDIRPGNLLVFEAEMHDSSRASLA